MICTPPSSTKLQALFHTSILQFHLHLFLHFPCTFKITFYEQSYIQYYIHSKFLFLFRPLWLFRYFVADDPLFSFYNLHQKNLHSKYAATTSLIVLSSLSHSPPITSSIKPHQQVTDSMPYSQTPFWLPSTAEPYAWIQAPFTSIKALLSCLPSPKIPLRNYKTEGRNSGSAEVNGNIATDFNKARTDLSSQSSSTRLRVSHRRMRGVSASPLLKNNPQILSEDTLNLTLSEVIHIDKFTDQNRRNVPDLKSLAKKPVNSNQLTQVETILSEEMTMLEAAPTWDSSRN